MKWEDWELVVVLSSNKSRLKKEQQCKVCQTDLCVGEYVRSFGVIDRKYGTKERWYVCEEHEHIFNYNSVEDCEEYLQQFLLDNRLTNEVWFKEL